MLGQDDIKQHFFGITKATAQHGTHYNDSSSTTATAVDPSGSGRVDMLTRPVAAARAAVATGAWVKSKHDMNLIRGSVGA